MKKSITGAYIVLFVIFICSIHMIFFACSKYVDTGNYENRELYELPSVSDTGYTGFAKAFENYYNDHIPFRNQLIALNNKVNYYIFHSTTGDQVLLGKDGWLFIKDKSQGNAIANYTGEDLLGEDELVQLAENITYNKKFLDEKGIEFVILISPNKSRVYSEYMPDYLGEPAKEYAVKQAIEYLRANTDVRIVYDYDALMDAKNELSVDNITVYHKIDTHWNNVGAYIGSRELLSELGVELPAVNDNSISIEAIPNVDGDLAGMLHMKEDFENAENNYNVTGYSRNNITKVQDDFNQVIEYISDADDDRTVYMSRDSFATAMGEYIGTQFARTYMRHHDTYSRQDLETVEPDVFVYEVVERSAIYKLTNLHLWE